MAAWLSAAFVLYGAPFVVPLTVTAALVTVVDAATLSVIVFPLMALITVLSVAVPSGPAPSTTILDPIPVVGPRAEMLATVSDVLPAVTDPVVVYGRMPPPWHCPQAISRSTHTAFEY